MEQGFLDNALQRIIAGNTGFAIPEELSAQLLHKLRTSLSEPTSGSEESIPLSGLFFRLYGRSDVALTTPNLSQYLWLMVRLSADAGVPPSASAVLRMLGDIYHNLYTRYGEVQDLSLAIECYTRTTSSVTDSIPEKLSLQTNLGGYHQKRFEATGELSDLSRALEHFTQVASLVADGDPKKSGYLHNLGVAYHSRFKVTRQLQDLELALEKCTQATSLTPDNHTDRQGKLSDLGSLYRNRYEQLGQLANLDAAIGYQTKALSLPSTKDPRCLDQLEISYQTRYNRLGDLSDLNTAIEHHRQAVSCTPEHHPGKPIHLLHIGTAYHLRYERLADLADLDTAIGFLSQAASLTPDKHMSKPTCLSNLGSAYLSRYERLGQLADLDASINNKSQAVALTHDEHLNKPGRLNNLGTSYQTRFGRLRQLSDLNAAIDCAHRAASLVPDSHPDRPAYLSNLGDGYWARYQRLGQPTDLNMAVKFHSQAVSLTPDDHPNKARYVNNLGQSYSTLYKRSGQLSDLDLAIQHRQRVIFLTSQDHPDRSRCMNGLAQIYHARYKRVRDLADLSLALGCQQSAVSGIPDGHFDRPEMLANLGQFLVDRFHHSHDATDVSQSINCFRQAAHSLTGGPWTKSDAALRWARLSFRHQQHESIVAYQHFMSLIPQVIWLGLTIESRYEHITVLANYILEAATVATLLQAYETAVEWLEQGRSIVWNQLLQLRSSLGEIQAVDAPLAEEVMQVAHSLHSAAALRPYEPNATNGHYSLEHASQRHRRLAEEWERLVHRVQSLPGMSDFLAPKKASELIVAGRNRVVVVVIVHELGCGALVMSPDIASVVYVPLGGLSHDKVTRACNQMQRKHNGRSRTDRAFTTKAKSEDDPGVVLSMLWEDLAKPVLDFLGYTLQLPTAELPCITWCTTGPLSFLPLHAAGDYTKPHSSLFDYAISSYVPNISSPLAHPPEQPGFSGIAMVGQASTPNFPVLPGTVEELKEVSRHANNVQTVLAGENATVCAVLEAMERHSWVHLACHAGQNLTNPTASAFHLHDGPLDLAAITQKRLEHADLAFLSACQTATGDKELSEEAVHLAAGMIMAGFRTVIATMWPINDQDAPLVADRFYEYMLKDGVPDKKEAARALHYAVGCLRKKVGVDAYWRWAPYIHMGR